MIECATKKKAELVIVSRDSDYGIDFEGVGYINDHLRHEFSERVSFKRKLLLYTRLSDALRHFKIEVSKQEVEAEKEIVAEAAVSSEEQRRGIPAHQWFDQLAKETLHSITTPKTLHGFIEELRKLNSTDQLSEELLKAMATKQS
jgi:hypothetical protein